ncbi:MAG: guanylate kinase [Syntrophothermus sp.]|nr:guanylate kinase [Ignavibacteriaceae bacterium]
MAKEPGSIIVVSAPSGAGKTSIVKEILREFPELFFSISYTTRAKRENETDGVEYFFISEDEFEKMIERDEFVEWEKFYDYYYGTSKKFINEHINEGKSIVFEVDVIGALNIKKIYPEAKLIYIVPPSIDELTNRLKNRKTENEEDLRKRVERAKMELSLKDKFDYFIDNEELEKAKVHAKELVKKIIKRNI